jgi:hypothetical protein
VKAQGLFSDAWIDCGVGEVRGQRAENDQNR